MSRWIISLSSPALDVTNVIVWGNISGSFYIDLQRAKVFNYDGAIKGPPFFSQLVQRVLHERFVITSFKHLAHKEVLVCFKHQINNGLSDCIYFIGCIYWSAPPIWLFGSLNKQNTRSLALAYHQITKLPTKRYPAVASLCANVDCTMWPSSPSWLLSSETSCVGMRQKANNLLLSSRKWLETDFQDLVCRQRAAVASKTSRAAAMSLANGILTILKAWNGIRGPDEVLSVGVLCPGDDTAQQISQKPDFSWLV